MGESAADGGAGDEADAIDQHHIGHVAAALGLAAAVHHRGLGDGPCPRHQAGKQPSREEEQQVLRLHRQPHQYIGRGEPRHADEQSAPPSQRIGEVTEVAGTEEHAQGKEREGQRQIGVEHRRPVDADHLGIVEQGDDHRIHQPKGEDVDEDRGEEGQQGPEARIDHLSRSASAAQASAESASSSSTPGKPVSGKAMPQQVTPTVPPRTLEAFSMPAP